MTTNDTRASIVVGFDGSAPARAALRHAVAEAHRTKVPLRIVTVFDYAWGAGRFGGGPALEQIVRERIQVMVDEAVAETTAANPGLPVSGETVLGSAGTVLVEISRNAAMIVVGNRGHGGFGGLTLGSVSQQVATHARCPVTVVRGKTEHGTGPVVVGADGSAQNDRALRTAFEEAARRGAELVAIRAYELPVPYGIMAMSTLPYNPDDLHQAESQSLAESVRPWREKFPDVPVRMVVARGSAGRVLVDVSTTAALVVVGSRGHGAFTGTLLGSVGLQLLHHADCPVLIVRGDG